MTSITSTPRRLRALAGLAAALACLAGPARAEIDLSGEWESLRHEDAIERGPGSPVGDFLGLPINEAGRLRGERWNAELLSVPEHQCIPHTAAYSAMHGNLRIWKEVDPSSQEVVAWHMLFESYNRFRTIWMDGRPHPSEHHRHTWQGFSTGKWDGDVLVITTTHLKPGHIRRNGIDHSDRATLVEHVTRHGDVLTFISTLEDPIYLTEPYIHSRNFRLNPNQRIRPYTCTPVIEAERAGHRIPHYLPGSNPLLAELAATVGLPLATTLGGAETMYPEYRQTLERLRAGAPAERAP
ncbi:MAG TPA: hypothetical protein VIN61_00555 [Gammaproteobacteria bacterium]